MITGSIVALVTPFHEDGSIDYERTAELIEWHIANQSDGILILGTTGESATLTPLEHEELAAFTVKAAAKRIPILAGVSSCCTKTAMEEAQRFEQLGVDALLVITPYYNKTNYEGVIHHFHTIADAIHIPMILYNIPGRTGMSLHEKAVGVLSKHPTICGIKEASGDIGYVTSIAQYVSEDFALYSGNDDMIVPMLSLGASGVISVLANLIPKEVHQLVMDYLGGDPASSKQAQLQYLPLIRSLFIEVNPIPIKAAMNLLHREVGGYRLPLYEMEARDLAILQEQLVQFFPEVMQQPVAG